MDKLTNFEKVALYLVDKSPGLCKVQIRKGLFLFDSLYYSFYKKSYTNCIYIKEKYGPVPNHQYYKKLSNILFKYTNINVEYQGYYEKTSYYIKENITLNNFFSEGVKKLLDAVIKFISNKTASEISKLTHGKVYNNTKMYSKINLEDTVEWIIDENDSIPNELEVRQISKEEENYILDYFLGESDVFANTRREKETINI